MATQKQSFYMPAEEYFPQYVPSISDGYTYAPMMVGAPNSLPPLHNYGGYGGGLPTPPRVASPPQDNAHTYQSFQTQRPQPTMLPSPSTPPRMSFLASLPYSPANASLSQPMHSLYGNYMMPYASPMQMGKHETTKVREQARRHCCSVCAKGFARPSALRTHMYTHTGEKPFRCQHPQCMRSFSVLSNLRRHQRVHAEDSDI